MKRGCGKTARAADVHQAAAEVASRVAAQKAVHLVGVLVEVEPLVVRQRVAGHSVFVVEPEAVTQQAAEAGLLVGLATN